MISNIVHKKGRNRHSLPLVLVYESDYLHEGPRTTGGMPSVGVFQRDTSSYLCEFWRRSRKTPNG